MKTAGRNCSELSAEGYSLNFVAGVSHGQVITQICCIRSYRKRSITPASWLSHAHRAIKILHQVLARDPEATSVSESADQKSKIGQLDGLSGTGVCITRSITQRRIPLPMAKKDPIEVALGPEVFPFSQSHPQEGSVGEQHIAEGKRQ